MSDPDDINPYASPSSTEGPATVRRKRSQPTYFVGAVVVLVGLLVFVLAGRIFMPPIYLDFDALLPWSTQLVLNPGLPALVALLLVLIVLKQSADISPKAKRVMNRGVIYLAVFLGLFVAYALLKPLVGPTSLSPPP